jgi:hypothetical protein
MFFLTIKLIKKTEKNVNSDIIDLDSVSFFIWKVY